MKHFCFMPSTGVEIIIPDGVEMLCLAKPADKEGEMEAALRAKHAGVELSFPLIQIVDNLKKQPPEACKPLAAYVIMEVLKAGHLKITPLGDNKFTLEKMEEAEK